VWRCELYTPEGENLAASVMAAIEHSIRSGSASEGAVRSKVETLISDLQDFDEGILDMSPRFAITERLNPLLRSYGMTELDAYELTSKSGPTVPSFACG
jgi:hypothetical protein